MNLSDYTDNELAAYAHGYTDAHTDAQPDLNELKRTCRTLSNQLAEAIADANYYRTCSALKPQIVKDTLHGVDVTNHRKQWRHQHGLDNERRTA